MGLYYPNTKTQILVGSKIGTTRTTITLTALYDVANKTKIFETSGYSKVNIDIFYTMGATETSNSIELRVESSPDRVNWYRLANESVSAGVSTLDAREFTFIGSDATTATISIGLDIFYKYIRVSLKETGVLTNFGSVYCEATLAGK